MLLLTFQEQGKRDVGSDSASETLLSGMVSPLPSTGTLQGSSANTYAILIS